MLSNFNLKWRKIAVSYLDLRWKPNLFCCVKLVQLQAVHA